MNAQTEWVILKAEKQGQVSLCRLRKTPPPPDCPTLLRIEWTYPGEEYNGFPHPELRAAMDRFEDVLAPLCERAGASRLMLVLTGLGLKEWSFYVRDFEEFMAEFNRMLTGKPVVPIKIVYWQDAGFDYWFKYRKHVKEPC